MPASRREEERWPATALQTFVALAIVLLGLNPSAIASPPPGLSRTDIVAIVGGEDMVAAQKNGWLETALTRRLGADAPRFRYLAWEGDTVFAQPRDLNFPSWPGQLERVGATVILCQFGQTESLRGRDNLPNFLAAYGDLLDVFAARGRRVVILSPTSFERPDGAAPDLTARNADLAAYVRGIRELAAKRGFAYVELFDSMRDSSPAPARLTRDGLHLNERGHQTLARQLAAAVKITSPGPTEARPEATGASADADPLRQAIVAKNQLWFHYWRPQNWAFLAGDRTEQPSSRDHRDPKVRWFPTEMQEYLPLIAAKEKEIAELAGKQREGVR